MKAAFHAGAAGLLAQQAAMDNIGNNIANVNTYGYKAENVGFESLLAHEMYVNLDDKPLTGVGVRAVGLGLNTQQGSFHNTGNTLDFAIQGEGWFAVDNNGTREYTRSGAFQIGLVNNVPYLTDAFGCFVLDGAGSRIQIPQGEGSSVDLTGIADRVGVFVVERSSAMQPTAENRYRVNDATGTVRAAVEGDDYTLRQGAVEFSNVKMEDEMTNMIMAQRAFQMSARVVQTSDELEQEVNTLRM